MSRFRKIKKRPYLKVKMSELGVEDLLYLWQEWHNMQIAGGEDCVTVKEYFLWLRKKKVFEPIEESITP